MSRNIFNDSLRRELNKYLGFPENYKGTIAEFQGSGKKKKKRFKRPIVIEK